MEGIAFQVRRTNGPRVTEANKSLLAPESELGNDPSLQFVAVASNGWDGQWMNRQHLMWAVKEYAPVVYMQETEPWYSSWKPRDEPFFRSRVEHKAPRLSVLRLPKALSAPRGKQGRWERRGQSVQKATGSIWVSPQSDRYPRIFYFWHPELYRYIELLQPGGSPCTTCWITQEYFETKYAVHADLRRLPPGLALGRYGRYGAREQAAVVQGAPPVIVP